MIFKLKTDIFDHTTLFVERQNLTIKDIGSILNGMALFEKKLYTLKKSNLLYDDIEDIKSSYSFGIYSKYQEENNLINNIFWCEIHVDSENNIVSFLDNELTDIINNCFKM